ncbi:MAG: TnpV protein [Lachnospiraceae bacterium]|nr:TnpV protein [Lachnospiraceae bacterium]
MEENIMQSIYEQCGGTYHEYKNGHLIPDLSDAETEQLSISVWGQRRRKYIKEYNRGLYEGLLLTGKLYQHLSVIDKQAQERYDVIVEQMKKAQGITELLKSENQFIWLQKMNSICDAAREIVNTEIIFV